MIKNSLKNELDQFYTKPEIAEFCVNYFNKNYKNISEFSNIVEPSAGSGNILKFLPATTIALDLEPTGKNIVKMNYFDYNPSFNDKTLVFGNPPFGKNASLAVKFFEHSAKYSDVIAFILPRTFRKHGFINKLNKKFHLIEQAILPLDSFITLDNVNYNVPTVFQIWEKKDYNRKKIIYNNGKNIDWVWTNDKNKATHAIRRVGVKAGKIFTNPSNTSNPSHYYLISNNEDVLSLMQKTYEKFWNKELELNPKWDTAGNPSLTKQEICEFYFKIKNNMQ